MQNSIGQPNGDAEKDEPEPIWGKDFISTYLYFADQSSRDNEGLNTAGMYCLLGQALKEVFTPMAGGWLDGRISVLMIQDSGTGKDPAFDFVKMIADLCGMKMASIGSITSAGLVGTMKKGGKPVMGVAYDNDIVGFKEASTLFKTTKQEHSNDLIDRLNEILDKNGHVCKRMAEGTIEYDTQVSLLGTTYPPRSGMKYIAEGFIPRLMVSFRTVDESFYFDVGSWIIQKIGVEIEGDKNDLFRLGKTISTISASIQGKYFNFNDARHELEKTRLMMQKLLNEFSDELISQVRPFITRYLLYTCKIATCIAAVDNLSHDITPEHMQLASSYIETVWKGTLNFVDKYKPYIGDKKLSIIEDSIRELCNDGENDTTLRSLMRRTHFNKTEVIARLMTLVDMDVIAMSRDIKSRGRPTTEISWRGYEIVNNPRDNVCDNAVTKSDKDVTK